MTLRLDRVNRLYLHCEITRPTAVDQKFHDIEQLAATTSGARGKKVVRATAFAASKEAAKHFRPRVSTQLSNHDDQAMNKLQLAGNKKAHHLAFLATQRAVEHFTFDEFVTPI